MHPPPEPDSARDWLRRTGWLPIWASKVSSSGHGVRRVREEGWDLAPPIVAFGRLEVAPEPPLLERHLCPVDRPRGPVRPSPSLPLRREAPRVGRPTDPGTPGAEGDQSGGVELEALFAPLASQACGDVVRHQVSLLMRHHARFAGWEVGRVADRPDVLPLR